MGGPSIHRYRVDPVSRQLDSGAVEHVVGLLRAGRPAILPTDTGYLLGVAALDANAVETVFEIKQRDERKTVHIACSSPDMVERYVELSSAARRLVAAFLPGPLSIVARATPAFGTERATRDGTVGVRIPDNPATLAIIEALGQPITATSANRSGGPPLTDVDDASLARLTWPPAVDEVAVVGDGVAIRHDRPSTMVLVDGDRLELLRPGPVELADLLAAVATGP